MPLAWNHYFIVLVLPAMLFIASGRAWLAVLTLALLEPPLAFVVGDGLWAVALRSECWAALICLAAMLVQGFAPGRRAA